MAQRELDKLVTFEEFEKFTSRPENRERYFELIDGEIVEKAMPTQLRGRIVALIVAFLVPFARANKLGHVEVEVRYRIPTDPHNARQPDLSFFADTTTPIVTRGAVPRMPDLAIEVKSPDDDFNKMRAKASYYLANGTRLVWVAYPKSQTVVAHTPTSVKTFGVNDLSYLEKHLLSYQNNKNYLKFDLLLNILFENISLECHLFGALHL